MKDDEYMGGAHIPSHRREMAQKTVQIIHEIMNHGCGAMEEPGAKIAFLAGVAMIPLGAIAAAMAGPEAAVEERFKSEYFSPTMDEIAFAAFYVTSALERHPQGMIAAFSIEAIDKACRMFKTNFGREYTNLAPILKEYIAKHNGEGKNVPDGLKQFLPE